MKRIRPYRDAALAGRNRRRRRADRDRSRGATARSSSTGNADTAARANRPIRQGEPHPFYDYSPMPKRPRLTWPNGARVAVHLVSNIEHWDVHDNNGRMDVRNLPRNDYGLRVAVWRLFDIFSERRITHTIALNSAVCRFYPEIIDAAKARGDEFMGHGITNVERLDSVSPAAAAEIIRTTVQTIQTSTGQRVRGWLGPGLTEGEGTLDSLKAAGIEYVCDWGTADDQPFQMKNGLYVVPYTVDINDIGLIDRQGTPASTFGQYIVDAFDTLYREGETPGPRAPDRAPSVPDRRAASRGTSGQGARLHPRPRPRLVRPRRRHPRRLPPGDGRRPRTPTDLGGREACDMPARGFACQRMQCQPGTRSRGVHAAIDGSATRIDGSDSINSSTRAERSRGCIPHSGRRLRSTASSSGLMFVRAIRNATRVHGTCVGCVWALARQARYHLTPCPWPFFAVWDRLNHP